MPTAAPSRTRPTTTAAGVAPLVFFDPKELGSALLSDQISVSHYTIPIIPGTYDLYTDGYLSLPAELAAWLSRVGESLARDASQ